LKYLKGPGVMTRSHFIRNKSVIGLIMTSPSQYITNNTHRKLVLVSVSGNICAKCPQVKSLVLHLDNINEQSLDKLKLKLTKQYFASVIRLRVNAHPPALEISSQLQTLCVRIRMQNEHELLGDALRRCLDPTWYPNIRHLEIQWNTFASSNLKCSTTAQSIRELQTWIDSFPCLTHLCLHLLECSPFEMRIQLQTALSCSKYRIHVQQLPTTKLWDKKSVVHLEQAFPTFQGVVLLL